MRVRKPRGERFISAKSIFMWADHQTPALCWDSRISAHLCPDVMRSDVGGFKKAKGLSRPMVSVRRLELATFPCQRAHQPLGH
jgi:hypothetical protein